MAATVVVAVGVDVAVDAALVDIVVSYFAAVGVAVAYFFGAAIAIVAAVAAAAAFAADNEGIVVAVVEDVYTAAAVEWRI